MSSHDELVGVKCMWRESVAVASAAALPGADDGMRTWARRSNAERGGYLGRPIGEQKGWTDRMAQMWGGQGGYAAARKALADELRALGDR